MNNEGRTPREPKSARGDNDPGPAPADKQTEPPPMNQWEEEGGMVQESSAEAPEAPSPPEPDYKDRWLRAEAELQNFRRRAARDAEETRRITEESALLELVTALDDLERALGASDTEAGSGAWREGVTLVAQRLRENLARRGVTVEDPLGRGFDPAFHEAMLEVDPPPGAAPGTVVQVIHKGYRRGQRALRPARVVVARAQGTS
jgi:molecular chaperone GrpE